MGAWPLVPALEPAPVDEALAPLVAPHTAENSAVLESCAEACAAAQTEPRIAGVIAVPSDPAPMPAPFTVDVTNSTAGQATTIKIGSMCQWWTP